MATPVLSVLYRVGCGMLSSMWWKFAAMGYSEIDIGAGMLGHWYHGLPGDWINGLDLVEF